MSPSHSTTSLSISATAAYRWRLSADHDTLRAIVIGRSPKSVSACIGPPDVGHNHTFEVAPSVRGAASHRPSGERNGWNKSRLRGTRSLEMRAMIEDEPPPIAALQISTSPTKPSLSDLGGRTWYSVSPSSVTAPLVACDRTRMGVPPSTGTFSICRMPSRSDVV